MTRQSWPLHACFCKFVRKNPKKKGFDGEHFFEPLSGQMGLQIGMYPQSNDIYGIVSFFLSYIDFPAILAFFLAVFGVPNSPIWAKNRHKSLNNR